MPDFNSIHLLRAGMGELAAPFTPEESVWVSGELSEVGGAPAELFVAGHCGSTFELAWRLLEQGRLPEWGAVLGLVQESGRGQLRRGWYSPLGNLHVSFRLPSGGPFDGEAATVLLGLLFCEAFQALGLRLLLKWPNDLVLNSGETHGKLGGMLLEEKNGVLVAGIGINAATIPGAENLRPGAGLRPALLPKNFAAVTPILLWLALVKSLIMIYSDTFTVKSHMNLLRRAEEKLLWRGQEVLVSGESGNNEPFYGVITGLSEQGGLMLLTSGAGGAPRHREIISGSIVGV